MAWIRTCQECFHKQKAKPPAEYKGDTWTEVQCKKCKSRALDYGQEIDPNAPPDPDFGPES